MEWWFLRFLNPYFLCNDVTRHIDKESISRWKAIPPASGLVIAVKHAHLIDHLYLAQTLYGLGQKCYYISIPETFEEFFGFGGFVVRRLGAFAIERGGINIRSNRFIVDTLVKAQRPLMIFPEGEMHLLNDVVTPLKAGLAFFALEGAEARANADKPNRMFILPVGLKYTYPTDIRPLLEQKLAACEKKLNGSPRSGEILPRLEALADTAVLRAATRCGIECEGNTYEERFISLSRRLIEALEMDEHKKHFKGDLSDRARQLIVHFKESKKSAEKAFLALHALSFYPNYLESPTQERLMETLRKLERFITGNEHVSFPGRKNLSFKFQEPIAVDPYLSAYAQRKTKRTAMEQLTKAVQDSLQEAINSLLVNRGQSPIYEGTQGISG